MSSSVYRKKNGGTTVETIAILILLFIFLIIAINQFMQNTVVTKESLLRGELVNIRMSIKLYKLLNSEYPESLQTLTDSGFIQPYYTINGINIKDKELKPAIAIKDKYLSNTAVDDAGVPLDPFGNNYSYDKKTGEINSLTKGYESW